MSRNEVAFVLDPEIGVDAVLAALDRFRCREGAGGTRRALFYDTFDGRLHRAGSSLFASEEELGWRLSWRNGSGGTSEVRTDRPIAFATDLPEGRLREVLLPLVEMRRLLPLVEVEHKGPALDVVDDEEKTVVRLMLEEGRARAPRERSGWFELPLVLRLTGVRGYEREWKSVLEVLSGTSGLSSTSAGMLDVALTAIGGTSEPKKLTPTPALDPGVRSDLGLKRIFSALFQIVLLNEGGVRVSLDTEFLHDFRVAVRRTRSLLGQVPGVFPEPVVDHFCEEFAWLGQVSGPTRDLDVFLLELDGLTRGQAEADIAPLREFLRLRQEEAHAELLAALDSSRYSDLCTAWRRFLDETVLPEPPHPNAALPLVEVAAVRIRRLHERVIERGEAIREDSPARKLHRLRLDCKKLRYLLDATKTLFDEKESRITISALKRLQDNLGDFNDCCVQSERLRDFAFSMTAEGRAPVGTLLTMGRLIERTARRAKRLRATFAERLEEYASPKNAKHFRRLLRRRGGKKPR